MLSEAEMYGVIGLPGTNAVSVGQGFGSAGAHLS